MRKRCTIGYGYEFSCSAALQPHSNRCAKHCSVHEVRRRSRADLCMCLPEANSSTAGPSRLDELRPSRFALLLRGEAFRWGCDDSGVERQLHAAASHDEHIFRPLARAGHTLEVYLPFRLDGSCSSGPARTALRDRLAHAYGGSGSGRDERVSVSVTDVSARGQSEGFRAALDWFLASRDALEHDFVLLTRFDLELRRPLDRWWSGSVLPRVPSLAALRDSVSFASRCEYAAWTQWNCTSDLLYVVARRHLLAFNASIGAVQRRSGAPPPPPPPPPPQQLPELPELQLRLPQPPAHAAAFDAEAAYRVWRQRTGWCCFSTHVRAANIAAEPAEPGAAPTCSAKLIGHGCYNVLARRIGASKLRFLFPMPANKRRDDPGGGGGIGVHPKYYVLGPSVTNNRSASGRNRARLA